MSDELQSFLKGWLGIDEIKLWMEEHSHDGGSEERILFSDDLKVFIKDYDATLQLTAKGCYLRGENFHCWFSANNLVGNAGPVIAIPPSEFQALLRYGGARNVVKGSVVFYNKQGADFTLGNSKWFRMPDGRYGLVFEFMNPRDGKADLMESKSPDFPFQFQYGVNVQAAITLI